MRQKSGLRKASSEKVVKDIRRATRKRHSVSEKIGYRIAKQSSFGLDHSGRK